MNAPFLLAALLSLSSGTLPASAQPSPMDEAALLYRRGRHAEALERLKLLGAPLKQERRVQLLLGLTLRKLGREDEAVEPLKQALEAAPGDLDAAVNLGLAYHAGGSWEKARAAFEAGALAHPGRKEPWLGLGMLAAGQGDWPSAQAHYERACAAAPKDPAAWIALADAMIQTGALRAGAEARAKALALGAGDAELHFKQAALWYGLGELELAAKDLARAEAPDQPEAYFLAGSLAYRRGDHEAAERNFKAALDLRRDYPEARLNLGITYYGAGRYGEAMGQFKAVRPRQPGFDAAQAYLREAAQAGVDEALRQGATAVLAGDFAKAVERWDQAESLAADKAAVKGMIASLRAQQRPRAQALALEADAALASGDLPKAALLWNDALSIDPENARAKAGIKAASKDMAKLTEAYAAAGRSAAASGDAAAARAWVQRLQALDPAAAGSLAKEMGAEAQRQLRALDAQAGEALKADKPGEALSLLAKAAELAPSNARLAQKRAAAEAALRRKVGRLLAASLEAESAGKLQEADVLAGQALALAPADLEARSASERLGRRLNLKRLGSKAVDELYYRGVYLYGAGQTAKALELWRQALEAAPHHAPLRAAVRSAETKLKTLAQLGAKAGGGRAP